MDSAKVDAFLARAKAWGAEMAALREIARVCPLDETMKWGQPCYTAKGANVVLIHGFKDYCALLFFKGALLEDPHKLLIRQTENVQASRQIRFRSLREIKERRALLKAYIEQAMAAEASGRKVEKAAPASTPLPPEFETRLAAWPELKSAFVALTPGRQRAYLLHFGAAKQVKTRTARIEKCEAAILAGKGLDDV